MKPIISFSMCFMGLSLSAILVTIPFIIHTAFGDITTEQLLYHLILCYKTFNISKLIEIYSLCFYITITYSAIIVTLFLFALRYHKMFSTKILLFILIFACGFSSYFLEIFSYLYQQYQPPSTFIEKHYAHPQEAEIIIPQKKRNVIIIFMESMEKTYENIQEENLIPYLSSLRKENISFEGFEEVMGTNWTIAAIISATSGLPIKIPFQTWWDKQIGKQISQKNTLLPKAPSIFDIFYQAGYNTLYMNGGSAKFAGKKAYLSSHNVKEIWGRDELLKKYKNIIKSKPIFLLSEDFLEDADLYRVAKKELKELEKQKRPFLFTLLTVNTHFPNGIPSKFCQQTSQDSLEDCIRCGDEMIKDFINWLKKQSFYQDTTIIILGDHLLMKSELINKMPHQKREIINIFINSDYKKDHIQTKRNYSTFDFAPSILEAAGFKLQSHRFGLGTSLFSNQKTLVEQIPLKEIDNELNKKSTIYEYFLQDNSDL